VSVFPITAFLLNLESVVDIKDIKAIIDLMKKNAISEFELERQDFKIRLKRSTNGGSAVSYPDDATVVTYSPSALVPAPASVQASALPQNSNSSEIEIKSPMVGTFYRAPSPEAGPYVDIGSEVHPESVVCIIEAMKVMNEIKSEVQGVITQVLVQNAQPVEYGQALFKLRPA
jgi:acetyl-CoA carboxylase biotin carboxyl carrier protein